jgi:hypothetical protein
MTKEIKRKSMNNKSPDHEIIELELEITDDERVEELALKSNQKGKLNRIKLN